MYTHACRVLDENDETPTFSRDVYTATLSENSPRGQSVLRVTAVDRDVALNADITYRLEDDPNGLLAVDARLGVVRTAAVLDHESTPVVTATVVAVDAGTPVRSSSADVFVRVANVDDEPLTFTRSSYSFHVAENQPAGTPVSSPSSSSSSRGRRDIAIFE